MTEITKETIVTNSGTTENTGTTPDVVIANSGDSSEPVMATQVQTSATKSQQSEYLIYYFFGAIEVLLGFRLVLKLMGASVSSGFVRFIYGITGIFTLPFEGIFKRAVTEGIETAAVLEPATIVAIIVYALLSWGIVKLVQIFSGEKQQG